MKFDIEIKQDRFEKDAISISFTRNGYQWYTQKIPKSGIRRVIDELSKWDESRAVEPQEELMDKEKQEFAEKIADYLFTDGFGVKAGRLVMEQHRKIDGAGWSRDVVIDVVNDFTNAEIVRLKAQAEEQQHVIDHLGFDIDHLKAEIERLHNLLEDVVNELYLSDVAINKHGQCGTPPAELVSLVLAEKHKIIAALKAGMFDLSKKSPRTKTDEVEG